MPRDVWTRFFASAEHEIGILAHSALFLAEDAGILRILADKGRVGVSARIALGDPDSPHVAERGAEDGIGDAMPAKVRNALTLYHPLREVPNIEIRLHRTTLYNSIYRADDRLLVNQHAYGVHASHAPVFCLNGQSTATWPLHMSRVSSESGWLPRRLLRVTRHERLAPPIVSTVVACPSVRQRHHRERASWRSRCRGPKIGGHRNSQ